MLTFRWQSKNLKKYPLCDAFWFFSLTIFFPISNQCQVLLNSEIEKLRESNSQIKLDSLTVIKIQKINSKNMIYWILYLSSKLNISNKQYESEIALLKKNNEDSEIFHKSAIRENESQIASLRNQLNIFSNEFGVLKEQNKKIEFTSKSISEKNQCQIGRLENIIQSMNESRTKTHQDLQAVCLFDFHSLIG